MGRMSVLRSPLSVVPSLSALSAFQIDLLNARFSCSLVPPAAALPPAQPPVMGYEW